ncbi:MAG: deoxynucleoside kinase [Eggerthellaceae bacterium]|jgi:dTMP kinase|nr:deoxynucleoside kinase [Eggerthellaceae bacterium]
MVAIEGLDGSGKETQTRLLKQALESQGLNVATISFPRYGHPSAAPVEEYLCGSYGQHASDVNSYAASAFFAVDRIASFLGEWREQFESADVFIADRYTTSNAIHQLSKLPSDQWRNFVDWLFDFEFNKLGLPKPTMVVYLRTDVTTSQFLLEKRYGGDESKRDVHERDLGYMTRSHIAADWCAEQFGWTTIECIASGEMRDREDVHREIMSRVEFV